MQDHEAVEAALHARRDIPPAPVLGEDHAHHDAPAIVDGEAHAVAPHEAIMAAFGHMVDAPDGAVGPAPVVAPAPTSAEFLSQALGSPIDQDRTHMIPTQFHRFWSGGKMSDDAMASLTESAAKTEDTMFQNNLWYSSHLERAMDGGGVVSPENQELRGGQREQLAALGYNVRDIAELLQDDPRPQSRMDRFLGRPAETRTPGRLTQSDMATMAGKATEHVQAGGADRWDGVKHISDMARLMYLNEVGGHHLDVDMGLGDMDLSRPYFHNDPAGRVPLMGAVTATNDDPIADALAAVGPGHDRDLRDPDTAAAGVRVAEQARDMTGMLNGMIASRPGNPNLVAAIEQLRVDAVHPQADIPSGMTANPRLLHGAGPLPADRSVARNQAVPPYLFDLQHLTEESDNR
ncbi:MAG: hypothetical protein K8W52_14705 [Deltaproteobacteria bacterium]|nr:hypothetical protein [Deltaproteobacteria bacterium]